MANEKAVEKVVAADGTVIHAVTPAGLKVFRKAVDARYIQTVDNLAYRDGTVKDALDELLYEPVKITSFTSSVGNVEKGVTVTDVVLKWALAGSPTTVTLNDEAQANDSTGKTLSKQTITANTTYTLKASDGKTNDTKSAYISFKNKRYWGVGKPANADAVDSAFVLALGGNELADKGSKSFTVTSDEGNFIFYAIPESWGDPRFFVGGFEGGFTLYKTFDFTNASGYTESYNVYKSNNADLGNTTVDTKY